MCNVVFNFKSFAFNYSK